MKNKICISLIALIMVITTLLSGCSEIQTLLSEIMEPTTKHRYSSLTETETYTKTEQTEPPKDIELTTDHKLFLEISIDTKEDELRSIADRYGYHLSLGKENTDTRSTDKYYVYELYDPSQFKDETEERLRIYRSYSHVKVTYYHANDDEDTQYIVSCKCSVTRGGKDTLIQSFDVSTGTTQYSYWKQVTTIPSRKDENWHSASSAEEAVRAYLSK